MTDFLVIGGGIAGASAGYFLSSLGRVTVLEMEAAPGYHATGRSAALFSEYYGNTAVRRLTADSRDFFERPPAGFADHELLTPRGTVALCPPGAEPLFEAMLAEPTAAAAPVREIGAREATDLCPVLRPSWFTRAAHKSATMDIDVDAVHQGFLRGVKAGGGEVVTGARVRSLSHAGNRWHAQTEAGAFSACVLVNAAGAWADEVAALAGVPPLGLTPLRRTAVLVDPPGDRNAAHWPMVNDVTETFYFKPESGRLLVSPADETPARPGDSRPDDLDVALAIERVNEATTLGVRSVRRAWSGLRTSAPGDLPVVGADPRHEGFVWLAGLGGYGVQISPAVGRLAAAAATA